MENILIWKDLRFGLELAHSLVIEGFKEAWKFEEMLKSNISFFMGGENNKIFPERFYKVIHWTLFNNLERRTGFEYVLLGKEGEGSEVNLNRKLVDKKFLVDYAFRHYGDYLEKNYSERKSNIPRQ